MNHCLWEWAFACQCPNQGSLSRPLVQHGDFPWRRLSLYLSLFHPLLLLIDSVNLTKWIFSRSVKKYLTLRNLHPDRLIMSDASSDRRNDTCFASCKLD